MILVNFKIYKETWGDGAIDLVKKCLEVMRETKKEIIPVVSALDLVRVKQVFDGRVFLQSVDGVIEGAKNGKISIGQAKLLGADGALINHSENRLPQGTIKKMLSSWPKDFTSVLCLQTFGQAQRWAKNIKADIIAYEPSELIGNKEKSVATEKSEMIKKFVEFFKNQVVIIGAGIKDKDDVKISVEKGAKGILVARALVTAKDQMAVLRDLASES